MYSNVIASKSASVQIIDVIQFESAGSFWNEKSAICADIRNLESPDVHTNWFRWKSGVARAWTFWIRVPNILDENYGRLDSKNYNIGSNREKNETLWRSPPKAQVEDRITFPRYSRLGVTSASSWVWQKLLVEITPEIVPWKHHHMERPWVNTQRVYCPRTYSPTP